MLGLLFWSGRSPLFLGGVREELSLLSILSLVACRSLGLHEATGGKCGDLYIREGGGLVPFSKGLGISRPPSSSSPETVASLPRFSGGLTERLTKTNKKEKKNELSAKERSAVLTKGGQGCRDIIQAVSQGKTLHIPRSVRLG